VGHRAGCTLLGAVALTFTRSRERHVFQEAVIGVIYAVSAAAAVLLADRAPHGAEHVRTMLVGNILTARVDEVARVAVLYASNRPRTLAVPQASAPDLDEPRGRLRPGMARALGDLLFCSTFGLVVASSVRIGGVLLVFSYLIVPSLAGSPSAAASARAWSSAGCTAGPSACSASRRRRRSISPPAPPSSAPSA
jgi:zinc/manganese transport system permease protein